MKTNLEGLREIYNDLKSKAKVRSSKRLISKQAKLASVLLTQINNSVKLDNSLENQIIVEKSKHIFKDIQKLIELKRLSERVSFKGAVAAITVTNRFKKYIKMTSILDIIKTASTLVPEFDGSSEKVNRVISAIKALEALINDANKQAAIQVILSKLSGRARSAVGDNPQEIKEIVDALKAKCSTTDPPEVILAKLATEKQTSELAKFTEQVEKLTLQLENAYLAENVPLATATRLAVRAGTSALANGLRNKESQLIIKAGKFDALSEAIAKANEHEKSIPNNAVLHYRNTSSNHNRNNQRGRTFRGNTNRGGYANRGRYQGNQYGSNAFLGRGGQSYRNGRGGYNYRGGNNHPNNRVFYAQQENMYAPQHTGNVGGIANMTQVNGQLPQQPNPQISQQSPQVALANIARR